MNIVVLAGGTSTERAISIVSGTEICKALREKGHRAVLVDIFCGTLAVDREDPFPEEYDISDAVDYIKSFDKDVPELVRTRKSIWGPDVLWLCDQADIVFLGLHGLNGEDGRVQATFDLMGIRYTGTGFLSSGLAMDKAFTKQLFRMNGIPTPKGITLSKDWMEALKDNGKVLATVRDAGMSFPVVVKTCCGGSSVGVYIVREENAYEDALAQAFSYEDQVIVEEYIGGREFTCAVVDDMAYPIVEIAPISGFYDYKNKYQPGSTIETCPAQISPELTGQIQDISVRAYRALGLTGYGRMDFMVDGQDRVYCLEANTLPGMTPTSLIPQEAAALGMSFPELCEELIRVSMKKYRSGGEGA